MADLKIVSATGKKGGTYSLSDVLSQASIPTHLFHRAVTTELANSRQGTQSARTRSEAKGGGRKPYKQKKTGNARQGTIRAPHYAHGGMALAVKPRDYTKALNKKERRLAIIGAFQAKVEAGAVIVVDKIEFATPRTKDATALLEKAGAGSARRILVVLEAHDTNS
ncbi:MAG: 50S ribosomal protein L4, partial [Fimbriimonadaceae bacterium]|nr:50S ribosomal protein L4 [Fimbriimonadaceae bacterium]